MEISEIIKFFLGSSVITSGFAYLAKLYLSNKSNLLIENHKQQLQLARDSFQNQFEISRIEHQIKFSKIHEERYQIIKQFSQDFYKLEQELIDFTTLFQGPDWLDKNSEKVIKCYQELLDKLEMNRIFFSEDLFIKLEDALCDCKKVISEMINAKRQGKYQKNHPNYKPEEGQRGLELWMKAEKIVQEDIKILKLELANYFRELIGV
jgi:hypothetical protein